MLGQIIKVFKALNSNAAPWQLSLGVCFGAIMGLTPFLNLHNIILLVLSLILNVNIGIMFLSWAVFSGFGYLLDPLFHQVGYSLLTAPALQNFWVNFFSCPIALIANLNNSIVMGSLVVSLILSVPLFFIFNVVVKKYRLKIQSAIEKIPVLKSLKVVKIYQTLMGER